MIKTSGIEDNWAYKDEQPFEVKIGKVFSLKTKSLKFQSFRGAFLALSLIYLLLYINWASKFNEHTLAAVLLFLSFLALIILLYVGFKLMSEVKLKISITSHGIEYPSFVFWKRTLKFNELFSSEKVYFNKKLAAIIVGKLDGSIIAFEKGKFESGDDFFELDAIVCSIVSRNHRNQEPSRTLYIHEGKLCSYLVQTIAFFLFTSLLTLLYFGHSVENISAIYLGALTKSVLQGDDIYRIFSAFFLHAGAIHLFSNLVIFTLMTDSLMRLIDVFRFLIVLFLSALIASIFSLYLSPHEYVIGASGGIFGLFGAYCVVKFTKYLPGTVSLRSNKMVLAIIALQIATEYFVDGIDSYSHAGGFIAGALCMSTYLYFAKAQTIYKSALGEKVLAVLLSGAYLWGLVTFLFKVYA